ncbi:MAG: 2-hydroxychromene-2-carboxylate isomerase [Burkholderiaceae bacterium]
MTRSVEFFFDFGSPASYLASTQLPMVAAQCDAQIVWRPMLLGGVFKATGNSSPASVPAKGRWMFGDLARWARRYGVAFVHNPHFPVNTLTLMRIATGLQMARPADFESYTESMFGAMWRDECNLGDPAQLAAELVRSGLDADATLALAAQSDVKARLIANTEEAVARGVFGAPSFIVGDDLFFGQDRLDFVREALGSRLAAPR